MHHELAGSGAISRYLRALGNSSVPVDMVWCFCLPWGYHRTARQLGCFRDLTEHVARPASTPRWLTPPFKSAALQRDP